MSTTKYVQPRAIRSVFGDHVSDIPVSSTTSATLRHVANLAESAHLCCALVPSYGFGGHNTALILARVP